MNLLEIPLLFYVACITPYVTQRVDALALGLTWTYVGLRVAHSAVHLSYNKVEHRLVLIVLWLRLILALNR